MKTKKIRQNIKETASVVTIQKYARRFLTEWNFTSNQKKATKESKRSNSLILLPTVPTEKKKNSGQLSLSPRTKSIEKKHNTDKLDIEMNAEHNWDDDDEEWMDMEHTECNTADDENIDLDESFVMFDK